MHLYIVGIYKFHTDRTINSLENRAFEEPQKKSPTNSYYIVSIIKIYNFSPWIYPKNCSQPTNSQNQAFILLPCTSYSHLGERVLFYLFCNDCFVKWILFFQHCFWTLHYCRPLAIWYISSAPISPKPFNFPKLIPYHFPL